MPYCDSTTDAQVLKRISVRPTPATRPDATNQTCHSRLSSDSLPSY
jgi:hypothetical protein